MFLSILHPARNPPASSHSTKSRDKASPDSAAFKPQGAEDPFLTNPSTETDQFTPKTDNTMFADPEVGSHAGHLPVGQREDSTESRCISPAALQAPDLSRNPSNNPSHHLSPGSHQSWLSPTDHTDNGYSDLSGYTSSAFDDQLFLQPDLSFPGALEDIQSFNWGEPEYQSDPLQPTTNDRDTTSPAFAGNPGIATTDRQLLSPVPTNTPSPRATDHRLHPAVPKIENGHVNSPLSVSSNNEPRRNARAAHLPTLKTNTCGDTLDVKGPNSAGLPPSPIVKVSSYTRGDSPSREEKMMHRQSLKRGRNGHLAPTQDDSSSDSEDDRGSISSGHRRTVSVPISALRSEEGSWLANPNTGQRGLDPVSRGDAIVPSPNEIRARQQREEKNAEVEQWLSISEANSEVEDNGGRRFRSRVGRRLSFKSRRRARSTGDPSMAGRASVTSTLEFDDSAIPGPGAILEVDSGEEDDDEAETSDTSGSVPESPPAQVDVNVDDAATDFSFSPLDRTGTGSEETVARVGPWYDLPRRRLTRDTKYQPQTSNAAMMRWARQNENVETASLAATVDTNDIESILGPNGRFSRLRIDTDNGKKKSRRESFLKQTIGLLHRSSSNAKRKFSSPMEHHQPSVETLEKYRSNDSMSTTPSPSVLNRRKPSLSKPHPQLNTNHAVMAMTGQMAAVGGGSSGPGSAASPRTTSSPWSIRRSRSKSEVPKGLRSHGGLMDLMTSMGGPPIPTLASPMPDKVPTSSPTTAVDVPLAADGDDEEDFDDDEMIDNRGIVMDLAVGTDLIVPSFDGFRTHVRQLNPRLEPALVDRVAKEQTLRYKRLVELKTKHATAVEQHNCSSKHRCFNQGGNAAYLPPRTSPKDPESTYGQFQVNGPGASEHLNGLNDGAVVPALFPPGVPLPPVSRLPAEFECSLCFKVKKFHKPSDWTKHVHEDLQPFTCTFPECTEPKSFKRKADWVRHESERHRHLEWWTCNVPDCPHTCYRKDNFVQHLVREHKMADPKNTSRSRSNRNSQVGWDSNGNHDPEHSLEELWRRVDECRHTTQKQPRDESCRFCGNVCTTWKKLTVHMAKHMEQISMPVLELVKQVKVAGESDTSSIATAQPQGSHLPTPISAYPGPKPGRGIDSPANAVTQAPIYNTGGLMTEAFGIPQPPFLSQQLRMQNAFGGMPHPSAPMAMRTPSYADAQYAQPYDQTQATSRANSATYPPPFNAIPRQQDMAHQPATTNMPYNLNTTNATASGSTTRFVDQQNLFASPVDNMGYVSYHGTTEHDGMGQQSSAPYTNGNMAGYPVTQGEGYIQPDQAQY